VGPAPPARGGSHLGPLVTSAPNRRSGAPAQDAPATATDIAPAHDATGVRRQFRPTIPLAGTERAAPGGAPGMPVQRNSHTPPQDPAASLGARVRELRRDRGLTLKALGRDAGLSHPFLSQLERGLARPSVGSVDRIARALGVPVSALWTAPRLASARLVRAGEGAVAAHGDADAPGGVRDLSADFTGLHVREWSGGSRAWADVGDTTTGEVMVHVVRGVLEVEIAGTVHALAEGDSLFFDGTLRHRLRRRGGARTRALYVATC
jgi:transcriptional regulator with XRE-family HTH domain